MIVRTAFKCLTCDQHHVVRIGMGHDAQQVHRFPCRGCGEDMVVALNIDYENLSTVPEAVENAELTKEAPGALVVNVHANYVIEGADRYTDMVFPHMLQMQAQFEAAERFGSMRPVDFEKDLQERPRPFRRPDYADEWQLLKKAWSLHSRGREKLADKVMAEATKRFHFDEPLNHLPDWVWRFSMFLGATSYEVTLREMMDQVRQPRKDGAFKVLLVEHAKGSADRSHRYFGVFRDYFSAWSEFSQVHFAVAKGMPVMDGHVATTSGFNAVRMFYGNAFEAFASSVDLLAFMNNVLEGRDWRQFRNIDADTYLRSDKPKRFDAFLDRPGFGALPAERDAQLRNASHHGALHHDAQRGVLTYREGKGNAGDTVELSYAEYLSRCSAMFFQIVTLLRFELLVCQITGTKYPV